MFGVQIDGQRYSRRYALRRHHYPVLRLSYIIERIIQAGKKKLVLDHVIVQKMDDDEGGGDVQSILTYGALALFNEAAASRDINCAFGMSYS